LTHNGIDSIKLEIRPDFEAKTYPELSSLIWSVADDVLRVRSDVRPDDGGNIGGKRGGQVLTSCKFQVIK